MPNYSSKFSGTYSQNKIQSDHRYQFFKWKPNYQQRSIMTMTMTVQMSYLTHHFKSRRRFGIYIWTIVLLRRTQYLSLSFVLHHGSITRDVINRQKVPVFCNLIIEHSALTFFKRPKLQTVSYSSFTTAAADKLILVF